MRKLLVFSVLAVAFLRFVPSPAQSPEPVVIQAISPAPAGTAAPPRSSASATVDSKTMVQLLQEMQATNAATLQTQEAAVESLEALPKAAEEVKIYSTRG
jgi:hypothetical protein